MVLAAACGDTTVVELPPTVRVEPASRDLAVGELLQLRVIEEDNNEDEDITSHVTAWKITSEPATGVVAISNHVLTAEGIGVATIEADLGRPDNPTANIRVTHAPLVDIELRPQTLTMHPEAQERLDVFGIYADDSESLLGIDRSFEWRAIDPSVVRVDEGLVTALAPGRSRVEVEHQGYIASANVTVSECEVAGLELRPTALALRTGTHAVLEVYAERCGQWVPVATPVCRDASEDTNVILVTNAPGGCRVSGVLGGVGLVETELGGWTAQADVTVQTVAPSSLTCAPDRFDLAVGERFDATCTATYSDASTEDVTGRVTCTASDPAVAGPVASASGVTQTEGVSTVTCIYEAQGVAVSDDIVLNVRAAEVLRDGCVIEPAASTIEVGEVLAHTLTCSYTDGRTPVDHTADANWTASATIASVGNAPSDKGEVTGVAAGLGLVTATFAGEVAQTRVNVVQPAVSSLRCDPAAYTLGVGSRFRITPVLELQSGGEIPAPTGSVSWSVAPSGICSVNAGGDVDALTPGSCTITGQEPSGLTCQVAVTVLRRCDSPSIDGSFAGGAGLWTMDAPWGVASPSNVGPSSCATGSFCAGTNPSGLVGCTSAILWTRRFNLCTLQPGELTIRANFRAWKQLGGHRDAWVVIQRYVNNQAQPLEYVDSIDGYSANATDWNSDGADLTQYEGESVRLGFYHRVTDGFFCRGSAPGLYIDSVELTAF
ncbi:MAG: hypothetical protein RMA76_37445 [Deltaproteobacteria bacterium]